MKTRTKGEAEKIVSEQTYVTVQLGEEVFGFDVTKVQEITGIPEVSFVPNAAEYMKGVMNLRGKVLPLVDLRIKFKLHDKEYDKLTVVMICEVKGNLVGMIVDAVSDVVNINEEDIQDMPHFTTKAELDCIGGVAHVNNRVVVLIDVDNIFSDEEIQNME